MHIEITIEIDALPQRVWEIVTEVERWPEWTKSVSGVQKLTEGPLAEGSRVRIFQPKLPIAVWTVTKLEPGRSFEWETSSPVIASVASHTVEPSGGDSRVVLTMDQSGLSVIFMGWWIRRVARRYMTMEAEGLKQRAEALS